MPEGDAGLVFPDGPRSELDRSLEDLVRQAQRVLDTQGRLRNLLEATQVVVEDLDLESVLRRIVQAAIDLVGAKYGVLGVIAPEGGLERFVQVGLPENAHDEIGLLPQGHGLLGALIDDPHPIRLQHLTEDPRFEGFPDRHPPMESFLGVPIRVRGEVFGNLYLSEQRSGEFTAEDEELVVALAATAGIAIDNARLFEESKRREQWAAASVRLNEVLLGAEVPEAFTVIAQTVAASADADLVTVVTEIGDGNLVVDVARGVGEDGIEGMVYPLAGSLTARALESGQPEISPDSSDRAKVSLAVALGASLAIPVLAAGNPRRVLILSRLAGRPRFSEPEIELARDFAGRAAIALELAQSRYDRERYARLQDRSRIARDLHDHVIQGLFASGIALQGAASTLPEPAASAILQEVDRLDAAIGEIRTAVFALGEQPRRTGPTVRHRILDVVAQAGSSLPNPPRVTFSGPLDRDTPALLVDDVLAVVREGLSNVARHAQALHAELSVSIDADQLTVRITDDGRGPAGASRSSGTANMATRAQQSGGSFSLTPREGRGSVLEWRVPLTRGEA